MRAIQQGLFLSTFIVLVSLPHALRAADAKWVKVQSSHFEIFTSAGERQGREAVRYFERIRSFFITVTNTKLPEQRVRIIAFGSNKDYEPFRPNQSAAAFYMSGNDRDYIVMGRDAADARSAAVHEFTHLLVKYSGVEMPIWLNEGLAELYSTLKPIADSVQIGEVIPSRIQYLRQNKFLPLAELTTVDHDSPQYNEKDRTSLFYSESWALTHMLCLNPNYRPGSSQFFVETAKGAPAEDVFQKIYGKSLDQVQKELRSYVDGDRFMAAIFDIKLQKSQEEILVAPAEDLETRMVLAELHSSGRRHENALKIYLDLVEAYPQEVSVREALGYYYLYNGNREGAKQMFAEAVKLSTSNAKLCYEYALLLQQDHRPSSEVIPLFERAIQLKYDYTEARLYLGLLLVDEEQFDKALLAFAPITTVAKREQAVLLYRAQAYARLRKGDREQAQKALDIAKKYAESPNEIAWVANLQESIDWAGKEQQIQANMAFASSIDESRPELSRAVESDDASRERVVTFPKSPTITGTLEQFDCLGARARMKIRTGGESKSFAISDPSEVVIMGIDAGAFEFVCGKQKPRSMTIEYEAKEDAELGTIGEVLSIQLE